MTDDDGTIDLPQTTPNPKEYKTTKHYGSLKQWMIGNNNTTPQQPSVLLLDGGVSTYLEQQLLRRRQTQNSKTSNGTETNQHNDEEKVVVVGGGGGAFSHRELWSSSLLLTPEGRDDIRSAHQEFYRAGSDIVTTVTYQCSHYVCSSHTQHTPPATPSRLRRPNPSPPHHFTPTDVDNMLQTALHLANEARLSTETTTIPLPPNKRRYTAASMGCYGAVTADGAEYTGDYGHDVSLEDLVSFHNRRFRLFYNKASLSRSSSSSSGDGGGPLLDALAFETIPCMLELKAVLCLLRRLDEERGIDNGDEDYGSDSLLDPAVWICLGCRDERCLNDGTPLIKALEVIDVVDPEGTLVHGVGVNCVSIAHAQSLVNTVATHMIQSFTRRAIVFYPNSGEEWDATNETWRPGSGCTDPVRFASEIVACLKTVYDVFAVKSGVCCEDGEDKVGVDDNGSSGAGRAGVVHPSVLVGGCCRTSPETIAALRCAVDSFLTSFGKENDANVGVDAGAEKGGSV